MAQMIHEFTPFTEKAFGILKAKLKEETQVDVGDALSGTIAHEGVSVHYEFDPTAKMLKLQLLKWPFFAPSDVINEKLHRVAEDAMFAGEDAKG